jgi:signal transduction histidine kinase
MERRLQIDRVVLRVAAASLAILLVLVAAFALAAFWFIARIDAESLRPILDLPAGASAYRAALAHAALIVGAGAGATMLIVIPASFVLAHVATRPLREARDRERRFAADAAHDLRTPLTRIASIAQAARRGDGDERDGALDAIASAALGAGGIVGDLLTLASTAQLSPAVTEPVDVGYLVRTVGTAFEAHRSGVRVDVDATDGVFVVGDEGRLRRLVQNLVDNAVRHARAQVTIGAAIAAHRVRITIDDDGEGVAPELAERIFDRAVGASGGLGLGLPICRWIARAHGGDVTFAGRSRFVVDLPRADG